MEKGVSQKLGYLLKKMIISGFMYRKDQGMVESLLKQIEVLVFWQDVYIRLPIAITDHEPLFHLLPPHMVCVCVRTGSYRSKSKQK